MAWGQREEAKKQICELRKRWRNVKWLSGRPGLV